MSSDYTFPAKGSRVRLLKDEDRAMLFTVKAGSVGTVVRVPGDGNDNFFEIDMDESFGWETNVLQFHPFYYNSETLAEMSADVATLIEVL